MPKRGLLVGSLALNLAEVSSVRQKAGIASAVNVVEEIGALLQERNLGTQELVHQLSEYASAAVTPGAGASYANSLKVVVQDLEAKIEKKITDGQAATQGKLDTLFQTLETANAAANTAKKSAVSDDKSWFTCAADEKAKRQVAEHAEQSLTAATSDEGQVCQHHQDNTGFKYDGTGKFAMDFACDHSVDGSCEAALKSWDENALQKMFADAEAHMAKEQKSHDTLKASCDAKTQARVEAKSTLDSAESAWNTKRATCRKLASARQTSMCAFGTKAQGKCSAEAEYAKLVAATKQAKGDADSEVDRESEWLAAGASKCMITNAIGKGLSGAVAGADLDACVAQVNFDGDVGKLNTRQAEFDTLSKANACAKGPITFFNGETWNVPESAKPSSKSYSKTEFTPQLDPTASNFDFCSSAQAPVASAQATNPCDEDDASCECFAHRDPNFCKTCAVDCGPCREFCGVAPEPAAPKPTVESRPTSKKCDIYVGDAGKTLGGESHSVVMALDFTESKENHHQRQWILNIGQQGTGAEHWLYTPASGAIQFGVWNGPQIAGVDISKAKHTLATVYDASSNTYSLFIDGKLAKTRSGVTLNIKNSVLSAGDKQGYKSNANFNGCISGVDIYYSVLTAKQVEAASAKLSSA